MSNFLQLVKERVVIYDGAMGTNIQKRNPTLDDYWGKENCSEVLVLSRPDIIRDIHADFFRVGCDIVETNTFGGTGLVLGEFDLRDKVREINLKAAQNRHAYFSQSTMNWEQETFVPPSVQKQIVRKVEPGEVCL